MNDYDDVVVGSGASGLTAALLLSMGGRKVLLLEKAAQIGGSLCRFQRSGVHFDTGFHFTGGLGEGGLLSNMLYRLGINGGVGRKPYDVEKSWQYVLESEGIVVKLPCGFERLRERLSDEFPSEKDAVVRYFSMMQSVCDRTPTMRGESLAVPYRPVDEDYVSLRSVLDELTGDRILKTVLGGLCLCHGVRPSAISFANHSRIATALHESVMTLDGGGDSLIAAFEERLAQHGVDIRKRTHISELCEVTDKRVGGFRLNTGDRVSFDRCVLTIHPGQVLALLPRTSIRKAFISRVSAFKPSMGFFTVFAASGVGAASEGEAPTCVALLPGTDLDAMLGESCDGPRPLLLIKGVENSRRIYHALQPCFPEEVAAWDESRTGSRPAGYRDYKAGRTEAICSRLAESYWGDRSGVSVLDAASMLTYRDYLNSPHGSAYGIEQRMGQINLLGPLRLRNLLVAGQSSVLPGVLGAMLSSFMICRRMLGDEVFGGLGGDAR